MASPQTPMAFGGTDSFLWYWVAQSLISAPPSKWDCFHTKDFDCRFKPPTWLYPGCSPGEDDYQNRIEKSYSGPNKEMPITVQSSILFIRHSSNDCSARRRRTIMIAHSSYDSSILIFFNLRFSNNLLITITVLSTWRRSFFSFALRFMRCFSRIILKYAPKFCANGNVELFWINLPLPNIFVILILNATRYTQSKLYRISCLKFTG